jgi:hypothetical protein
MIWLALLTPQPEKCVITCFFLMAASLRWTLNTILRICARHGTPINQWKICSGKYIYVVDYAEAGGVTIGPAQKISVAYTKVFATGSFMSACRRWNEKEAADKTWGNFKTLIAAAQRQHKQIQGESAACPGYHACNASVGQTEDQMADAAIWALASLVTATAADRGMVATLTEANARLTRQLEERPKKFNEVKVLLKKERAERGGCITFTPSLDNYWWYQGYKVIRSHTNQSCTFPKDGHKREATKNNNMGGSQANKELFAVVTSLNNREKFEDFLFLTPPLLYHDETVIVDSGCTGHFLLIDAPCRNKIKVKNPLRVRLPNGETMDSTNTSSLDIPEISEAASVEHFPPYMANNSLLSVGQLCNDGYYVTFRIDDIKIYNLAGKSILKGQRDLGTGLWRINLRSNTHQLKIAEANNVYELRNTGMLVNYLYTAMFSPTKSALLQAVKKGHPTTWSGLTEDTINTYLKITPSTAMGHMNQKCQNVRLTRKEVTSDLEDGTFTPVSLGTQNCLVYTMVIDQGQLYTYLTGRFPIRSSNENWYVMVCYSYD